MDAFCWNQYYVTRLKEIDDQHMRLVTMINRLGNMVATPMEDHHA